VIKKDPVGKEVEIDTNLGPLFHELPIYGYCQLTQFELYH